MESRSSAAEWLLVGRIARLKEQIAFQQLHEQTTHVAHGAQVVRGELCTVFQLFKLVEEKSFEVDRHVRYVGA